MGGRLRDDCFALPPGVEWTPVEEALARLRDAVRPVTGVEEVTLDAAHGRILAADVRAVRTNPPRPNSAVDGYGFAWSALAGAREATLPLVPGRAAAGHPWPEEVPPGYAIRILTGAQIPPGVDTVVLQEDAELLGDRVRFVAPSAPGANVRPAGEDATAGEVALAAGRRLGPAELARLAAVGVARVPVRERLRVAVLSTGDELMEPGAEAPVGICDANRPMLRALIAELGLRPVDLGIAPDRAAEVRAALDRGAAEADAIVTSGGASAGDEDHISRLLRTEGRLAVWRIAMKPGRPLLLGFWRGVPVFGLPGNPVAAFVTALLFARPALGVLAGRPWLDPRAFVVPAGFSKRKKAGRREYLRARLDAGGRAEVFHSEGSGLVGGLAWAEGLVELPDEAVDIAPGDPVRYLPFASFGLAP